MSGPLSVKFMYFCYGSIVTYTNTVLAQNILSEIQSSVLCQEYIFMVRRIVPDMTLTLIAQPYQNVAGERYRPFLGLGSSFLGLGSYRELT